MSEIIQTYSIQKETGNLQWSFDVLPAGDESPNPAELLSSMRFEKLIDQFRLDYEYILFDFPPILEVSDAIISTNVLDGMIMIVRADYCDEKSIKSAVEQVKFVDTKIVGFVFNASHEYAQNHKGKNYMKYYYRTKR